jgi:hypothetical protein
MTYGCEQLRNALNVLLDITAMVQTQPSSLVHVQRVIGASAVHQLRCQLMIPPVVLATRVNFAQRVRRSRYLAQLGNGVVTPRQTARLVLVVLDTTAPVERPTAPQMMRLAVLVQLVPTVKQALFRQLDVHQERTATFHSGAHRVMNVKSDNFAVIGERLFQRIALLDTTAQTKEIQLKRMRRNFAVQGTTAQKRLYPNNRAQQGHTKCWLANLNASIVRPGTTATVRTTRNQWLPLPPSRAHLGTIVQKAHQQPPASHVLWEHSVSLSSSRVPEIVSHARRARTVMPKGSRRSVVTARLAFIVPPVQLTTNQWHAQITLTARLPVPPIRTVRWVHHAKERMRPTVINANRVKKAITVRLMERKLNVKLVMFVCWEPPMPVQTEQPLMRLSTKHLADSSASKVNIVQRALLLQPCVHRARTTRTKRRANAQHVLPDRLVRSKA